MIVSTPNADDKKRCTVCCEVQPIGEFRRRRRGSENRHSDCRVCRNRRQRNEYARQKFKRDGNLIAENMQELKGAANFEQVQYLLGRAIGFFGGLENFADAWEKQTKAEMRRNLGGRRASDFFAAVARGHALCNQQHSVALAGLNAEESGERLAKYLLALLTKHPHEAAAGMRKAGWPAASRTKWTH